jgi:hypothetical protein
MRRIALLIFALLVVESGSAAAALQIVEPRAGAVLRGGSFATLQWSAATLPPGAEEWEAFLSLDGGAYYAVRITPHLDVARRQFSWLVPNVDTRQARILIRTGDERRETLFELPATFAIVRDARAALPRGTLAPAAHAEAAREGDPGVVAWTDGDRSGGALVQQWAGGGGARVGAAGAGEREGTSAAVTTGTWTFFVVRSSFLVVRGHSAEHEERTTNNEERLDILLLCRRLNV